MLVAGRRTIALTAMSYTLTALPSSIVVHSLASPLTAFLLHSMRTSSLWLFRMLRLYYLRSLSQAKYLTNNKLSLGLTTGPSLVLPLPVQLLSPTTRRMVHLLSIRLLLHVLFRPTLPAATPFRMPIWLSPKHHLTKPSLSSARQHAMRLPSPQRMAPWLLTTQRFLPNLLTMNLIARPPQQRPLSTRLLRRHSRA